MKQYSIEDLQDMIAEQEDRLNYYTDMLEDFTCPAIDCSECFSECGHEIFTDEIQIAEDRIQKYQFMIEDIQEGQNNDY